MQDLTIVRDDVLRAASSLRNCELVIMRDQNGGIVGLAVHTHEMPRIAQQMEREKLRKMGVYLRYHPLNGGESGVAQALITPCEGVSHEEQFVAAFPNPEGWRAAHAGDSFATPAREVRRWRGGVVYHQRYGLDI